MWKTILWRFKTTAEMDIQKQKMNEWIEQHRADYEIRSFFVNNAWAVEYRELIKM